MTISTLSIVHFNDVYRVQPQKISPKSTETIDVTQFAALLDDIRSRWPMREDDKRDGLVLFSGDVFSPSVESSVTRGSHMVPVMNELAPDVSLTGNHDFDFGYPHLSKLVKDTNFPWLLSNVIDTTIMRVPNMLHEFEVLERAGVRIGIIGLVEKDWISTVPSWPHIFQWKDMQDVGKELSARLRDPKGEYKCDIIIALTHCRVPNDIALAKLLHASSPSMQAPHVNEHGVDLILGGHDHLYYVSRGVTSWDDYDTSKQVLGAHADHGDVLVVKSGTDFRDLSEITLELEDTPKGSVRRKLIKSITGKRHTTKPGSKSSEKLTNLLSTLLSSVSSAMKAPVCKTSVAIDLRSEIIRTTESVGGNLFADILRHAYDDALCLKGCGGSDGVFICAGTLRGDSIYGPGIITLGDILEMLPFEDPVVVLELDGATIWAALEASLSTWPAQEGRFPVISGLRVSWDSRKPPGERVLDVWLLKETEDSDRHHAGNSGDTTPRLVDAEKIERRTDDRKYKIVTREYMAQGHDGFLALKGKTYLVDDEVGQLMSAIVRKYFLGAQYINKMTQVDDYSERILHDDTAHVLLETRSRRVVTESKTSRLRQHSADLANRQSRSGRHYKDRMNVSCREHMSDVDSFDGTALRGGKLEKGDPSERGQDNSSDAHLIVVHPVIDERLKDTGRY